MTSVENKHAEGEFNKGRLNFGLEGHEESLYDFPRPTITCSTFTGNFDPDVSSPPSLTTPGEVKISSTVTVLDSYSTTAEQAQQQQPEVSSFSANKPVIADVKLIKSEGGGAGGGGGGKMGRLLSPPEGPPKESWSSEAIHRLDILSDLKDEDLSYRFKNRTSSFVNSGSPNAKQSVYIDLGEYQTLLRHDNVLKEDANEEEEGRMYSLPQPQGYGDDTLKAVQTVTQKFDSFKLRQMRVRSFREGSGYTRRRSSNSGGPRRESSCSGGSVDVDDPVSATGRGVQLREKVEVVEGSVLTEKDVYRIEVFYRGQEAEVYVCRCLADVFVGVASKPNEESYHWVHTYTGVPVLLLNTGLGLKPRELVLLIAQKDTALPLWQDKVTYLSKYQEVAPGVHTMKVSGSLSKAVQLKMIDPNAAKDFLDKFTDLTSNPEDDLLKISADQNQAKDGRKIQKKVQPTRQLSRSKKRHITKADISRPCNSTILTKVDARDLNFRSAFGNLLPALKLIVNSSDPNQATAENFRPRLPTN